MAQTSKYPTKLFINGTEATSVFDIAIVNGLKKKNLMYQQRDTISQTTNLL